MKKYIGKAIRVLRNERDMTLRELADQVSVQLQSISRYERGDRRPADETLNEIAEAFGLDVDDIMRLARQKSDEADGATPDIQGRVTSSLDRDHWRDRVATDERIDQEVKLLLFAVSALADQDSWVASFTLGELVERVGLEEPTISAHWDEMLESGYVERLGKVEWTLKLVFPEQ